ncbi:exonuclease domain-containing protein [Nocardia sp. NPDC057668]|uniref:exonuclease domain-containing protein n=1 Tax=Nocardia sp. NPDC057668 TaxID=3346202 RepID=UPI00366BBE3B
MGLSFAAIDVETANSARGSICAVGVSVVRDGRRVDTRSWLCRPPRAVDFFNQHNIRVHGISAATVADEPGFAQRWPEVAALVGDLPLVAHNASFDSGALSEACTRSGITMPAWEFSCSLAMSRRHLDLESYRLPDVAAALDIPVFAHHEAGADAMAAADIVLALAARTGVGSLFELETTGVDRPYRSRRAARPVDLDRPEAERSERSHRRSFYDRPQLVMPEVTGADPTHPLHGRVVVFTGELASMTRQQAWDAIAIHGATPAKNVTRRTTALVIGDRFTGDDPSAFSTTKAARVAELRSRGQHIEVLDEGRLRAYLGAHAAQPAELSGR